MDRATEIALGILAAQLVVPLLLGIPVFIRGIPDDPPGAPSKKRKKKARDEPVPDVAPLAPLVCAHCHAPVPLLSASFPCPSCGTTVEPPPDYVTALGLRERAQKALAKAERIWRWSRLTSSPWLLWPMRVMLIGWCLAVGWGALMVGDAPWVPGAVLALDGIVAFFEGFVGLFWIQVMADMRKSLPGVPHRSAFACPAEDVACRGCGAPVHFDAGRLATVCNYCEADNYRAALARAAHQRAGDDAGDASRSLLDATRDIIIRRNELVTFIAFIAFAEIFYAVVFGGVAVYDKLLG